MTASISSASLLDLYEILHREGIVSCDIESVLGYSRAQLKEVGFRVPISLQDKLWDLAIADPGKPNIGLLVGTQVNTQLMGILSQLLVHSNTLGEALNHFVENIALMNQCEKLKQQTFAWGVRLVYQNTYSKRGRISEIERSMSALITWAVHLSGEKVFPIRAGFPFAKVAYWQEYQGIFGEGVLFDQDHGYLDFSHEVLALPITTANEFIKDALLDYISVKMATVKQTKLSLRQQVKHVIADSIQEGDFSSDAVALKLNMSRQTLHRKLTLEKTNFRTLLGEVRREKVLHFLLLDQHVFDEISEALGFKEPSAFYRAFKSWFNMTPNAYRQRMKQGT